MRKRYRFNLFEYLAQCDQNYVRLSALLYKEDSKDFESVSVTLDQHLENISFYITESTRYTSQITIVQQMPGSLDDLVLKVRAYHDVCCSEVLSFQGHSDDTARYDYPNEAMRTPDEKMQNNRLLGEMLELCLGAGTVVREIPRLMAC